MFAAYSSATAGFFAAGRGTESNGKQIGDKNLRASQVGKVFKYYVFYFYQIATIAYDRQYRVKFEPIWLEDFDEKIVFETLGSKITPLVVNPGKIVLSTLNLYFQPFNNIEPVNALKNRISSIFKMHS